MELPEACSDVLAEHLRPEVFKALADPRRLALLAQLAVSSTPVTVGRASECCSVHLSGVSRHLSILKQAGVVSAQKTGREVTYQLNASVLTSILRGLADAIDQCCAAAGCCTITDGEPNNG